MKQDVANGKTREARFALRPEVRAEGEGRFISGHAAIFDTITAIGGMFLERIKRGAFARAIREKQDVRALMNHDPNLVLGRVSNNTLELREDATGLWFRCDVARTAAGDDLLKMIRRNDVGECSFGFMAVKEEWSDTTNSNGTLSPLRTLLDCNLYDVSVVTYPAYEGTGVTVDEGSRMAFMFAGGPPVGAPMELRSRIKQAIAQSILEVSDEEYLERLRARKQAEGLLTSRFDDELSERLERLLDSV